MKIRSAIKIVVFLASLPAAACSTPDPVAMPAGGGPEMTAQGLSLETADFSLRAAAAEFDAAGWRLTEAGIETRRAATGLKISAPRAAVELQTGRITAAGGVAALVGQFDVRAGSISLDPAQDVFSMADGVTLSAAGFTLEGASLKGRISAAADFEVSAPRLRLKAPYGE